MQQRLLFLEVDLDVSSNVCDLTASDLGHSGPYHLGIQKPERAELEVRDLPSSSSLSRL